MKKNLLFLVSIVLFAISSINAQNLVLNPGLEDWAEPGKPTSWSKAQNIVQETDLNFVNSGSSAGRQTNGNQKGKKILSQDIQGIVAGESYTISFYYLDNAGGRARMWSCWKSGTNNLNDNSDLLHGSFSSDDPNWQHYEETIVAPATADGFHFEVRTYDDGYIYYDDFSVTKVTSGTGFEPVISEITHTPLVPTSSETVDVSATITDDGTLDIVSLNYIVGSETYSITMTNGGSGDIYTASIPVQANGTLVEYWIFAKDNDTYSSTSSTTNYTVTDPVQTIAITTPADGSTVYNTTVNVVCDVQNFELGTDGYISYIYGGTTYTTTSAMFDLTGLDYETYTLTATLFDNAGLALDPAVTSTVTFTVEEMPTASEVFISEIAGKGHNAEYKNEYIELTNIGSSVLSLEGWSLEYWEQDKGLEETVVFDNNHNIDANSTFVIAARSSNEINPDFTASFSMNNQCYVVLKNENGEVINQAGMDSDMFNAKNKNFEFTNCGQDNSTVASWNDLDVANGTPGALNCEGIVTTPNITITAPADGSTVYSTTVAVNCDIQNFELGTDGYILYNYGGSTYSSTTAMFDITGLSYETYTLSATLVDNAGLALEPAVTYTVTFTVEEPVIPSQLFITNVNPTLPIIDATFAVTVEVQDATGAVGNVTEDTEVTINLVSGTGTLSGTVTGTILSGTSSIVIENLSYSVAETIEINSATTSGMMLTTSANKSVIISEMPTASLFISEYIEGSSSNKAIEIYNPTGSDVDLTGYSVKLAANENSWDKTLILSETNQTLAAGDVFVIANANADPIILAESDVTSDVTYFNGNDAVGLFFNDVLIDVIGIPAGNPTSGAWEVAGELDGTKEHTLVRKYPNVTTGNTDWASSAGTDADNSEWIIFAQNDFNHIGWHGEESTDPSITITEPLDGSTIYTSDVIVKCNVQNFVVAEGTGDGKISIDLNGETFGLSTSNNFNLTDLEQGNYILTTTLVDNDGVALNPNVSATVNFTVAATVPATEVATIAELRAGLTDGTVYKLTGEAIITFQEAFRNHKFIEDATAAILIDDNDGNITTEYSRYDGITGITGTLSKFAEMLQFVPTIDPGEASSTGNTINPQVITIDEFTSNFEDYEAELVTINDATFTDANGTFAVGTVYEITDASKGATNFRTNFYSADYIGETIPSKANITGICIEKGTDGITFTARDLLDLVIFDNVNTINENIFTVYPNPANDVLYIRNSDKIKEIIIFNSLGQRLINTNTNSEINISNLKSGMYYIKIQTIEERFFVKTFVKN